MTPEVALMAEVWDKLRAFIPIKERLAVAESIVRLFDEYVDVGEAEHELNEVDSVLKAAIISHFDIGLEDDDDDEYEYE